MNLKLKELREQNGYEQEDLERLLAQHGVHYDQSTISRWERNNRIKPDAIFPLCQILKTNPSELLGWDLCNIA